MTTDPIADMLTRIRNAMLARQDQVLIPASRMKLELARILKNEGYIQKYTMTEEDKPQAKLRINLKYTSSRLPVITQLKRVSTPARRIYAGRDEIPRVKGGLGISILTTSRGIMTDREARRLRVGGEIICTIW
jgi:small subunit ribosomal protein S8